MQVRDESYSCMIAMGYAMGRQVAQAAHLQQHGHTVSVVAGYAAGGHEDLYAPYINDVIHYESSAPLGVEVIVEQLARTGQHALLQSYLLQYQRAGKEKIVAKAIEGYITGNFVDHVHLLLNGHNGADFNDVLYQYVNFRKTSIDATNIDAVNSLTFTENVYLRVYNDCIHRSSFFFDRKVKKLCSFLHDGGLIAPFSEIYNEEEEKAAADSRSL